MISVPGLHAWRPGDGFVVAEFRDNVDGSIESSTLFNPTMSEIDHKLEKDYGIDLHQSLFDDIRNMDAHTIIFDISEFRKANSDAWLNDWTYRNDPIDQLLGILRDVKLTPDQEKVLKHAMSGLELEVNSSDRSKSQWRDKRPTCVNGWIRMEGKLPWLKICHCNKERSEAHVCAESCSHS